MQSAYNRVRDWLREVVEGLAQIVVGEPVRIIRKSTLDRLSRLSYRQCLAQAEREGNVAFIETELRKNQLTAADLRRIAKHHKPIEQWPDEGDDELLHESAFADPCEEDPPATASQHRHGSSQLA